MDVMTIAANNKLTITNAFFCMPKGGVSYTVPTIALAAGMTES